MKIAVIGGGIVGLTCAVLLQEAGEDVHVFARKEEYESALISGSALAYPYGVEDSPRLQKWLKFSEKHLSAMSGIPQAGVSTLAWVCCAYDEESRVAPFFYTLPKAKALSSSQCPEIFTKGLYAELFTLQPQDHFAYALNRFRDSGGVYEFFEIGSVSQLSGFYDLAVNAGGLCQDIAEDDEEEVLAGREQIVIVENPGMDCHFSTFEGRNYIYPQGNHCIIGGSIDWGADQETPNINLAHQALLWASEIDARFMNAEILDIQMRLRPVKAAVRLEKDKRSGVVPLIHNYGHGDAAYALAWGCAQGVLDMVMNKEEETAPEISKKSSLHGREYAA